MENSEFDKARALCGVYHDVKSWLVSEICELQIEAEKPLFSEDGNHFDPARVIAERWDVLGCLALIGYHKLKFERSGTNDRQLLSIAQAMVRCSDDYSGFFTRERAIPLNVEWSYDRWAASQRARGRETVSFGEFADRVRLAYDLAWGCETVAA